MRLLLVRHGETAWNAAHRLQGDHDVPLSEAGRAQARALDPLVAAHVPVRVVTSPLARARETAELLGYPEVTGDRRWQEAHLGDWTGRPASELPVPAYPDWRAGRYTPPGGESFAELTARVVEAVAGLDRTAGTTLVVTHGGPIRALCHHLLGLHPTLVVPVAPASLTVLELDGTDARLRMYNVTPTAAAPDPTD
ncbi:histidine phosphatase family protein [Pseudonocardia sp.]|uniref:histidine phosphatase family protein n=1 Tax=Pseudonocardia sp. TaxID=60912 RepID=UPI0026331F76|nr:histidine phosphatase family protein [Pseudonocardia sp.]